MSEKSGGTPAPIAKLLAKVRRSLRMFEGEREHTTDDDGTEIIRAKWAITVVTEADELDGGFIAWVEELPGCVAQGETEDEALESLADAVSSVLATRIHEADPTTKVDDHTKVTSRQVPIAV